MLCVCVCVFVRSSFLHSAPLCGCSCCGYCDSSGSDLPPLWVDGKKKLRRRGWGGRAGEEEGVSVTDSYFSKSLSGCDDEQEDAAAMEEEVSLHFSLLQAFSFPQISKTKKLKQNRKPKEGKQRYSSPPSSSKSHPPT